MTDLPDRILAAIEQTASDAQHALGDPWVARKEPLDTLRRCEADKRTVERHRCIEVEDPDYTISCRYLCFHCAEPWPCPDLLDRADAYGIEAS